MQDEVASKLTRYIGPESPYGRQRRRVEQLERQLKAERAKLVQCERPVRQILNFLDGLRRRSGKKKTAVAPAPATSGTATN